MIGSWNLACANILGKYARTPNFCRLVWRMTGSQGYWEIHLCKDPRELPTPVVTHHLFVVPQYSVPGSILQQWHLQSKSFHQVDSLYPSLHLFQFFTHPPSKISYFPEHVPDLWMVGYCSNTAAFLENITSAKALSRKSITTIPTWEGCSTVRR